MTFPLMIAIYPFYVSVENLEVYQETVLWLMFLFSTPQRTVRKYIWYWKARKHLLFSHDTNGLAKKSLLRRRNTWYNGSFRNKIVSPQTNRKVISQELKLADFIQLLLSSCLTCKPSLILLTWLMFKICIVFRYLNAP